MSDKKKTIAHTECLSLLPYMSPNQLGKLQNVCGLI